MNEKRSGCQVVSIGHNIYVMGGENIIIYTSSVEVLKINANKLIPPHEVSESTKTSSNGLEMVKGDASDKTMNDSNNDGQPDAQSAAFLPLCTSKNDPTNPSFVTVLQRVLFMEETIGFEHDPSALLIRRIKFLETNICEESQKSGKALLERVDNLEVSYFGKK